MWAVRGWALSNARSPPLAACGQGLLPIGCGWGGAWGPVTNPTAHALASWLCALQGRHEGTRGGGSCLGVGRPWWGALSRPNTRPWGVQPGLATHWLQVRRVWSWKPVINPTERSCVLVLCAVGAARGRPGGGRPGWGALPRPTTRPWGVRPGPATSVAVATGGVGVTTLHQPHSARSCEFAFRSVGAARGRMGRAAPLAVVWGVRRLELSHARPPVFWASCRGPLPTCCGCGGGRRSWVSIGFGDMPPLVDNNSCEDTLNFFLCLGRECEEVQQKQA